MKTILKIAVPAPIATCFDYLPPEPDPGLPLRPGCRVRVPFGRTTRIGILMRTDSDSAVDPRRLRPVLEVLDTEPLFGPDDLRLLEWASRYYHHPIGEVTAGALPAPLRQGRPAHVRHERQLRLTPAGRKALATLKAPRQAALLRLLQRQGGVVKTEALVELDWNWRPVARALAEKGFLRVENAENELATSPPDPPPPLNPDQRRAVDSIVPHLEHFAAFLLEGVTGSGKTEVYLSVIERILAQKRQVLVLLPEIALTPQLKQRFERRLPAPVGLYHSGLSDGERMQVWLKFRNGELPLLLGTRSAVFVPMARPGLIVVDEEHDPSFKQQEGFRFSARDVAVIRARIQEIPVILGSATPSLESLHNARSGRYHHLRLPHRAGNARPPRLRLQDIRRQKLRAGLAPATCERIEATLARGEQVLLFLNRRGFAPTLMCHDCGWVAECRRCDTRLVVHRRDGRLRCHHCGHERAIPETCPACGSGSLLPLGQGTERVEAELSERFPGVRLARIDRDVVRRKGKLEAVVEQVHAGDIDILLGTQMLAKGHHFPDVTLVVVLDADAGFYSVDFRAPERMAQLIVQVAGRAGRADKPGRVIIQTRHPEHPLLAALLSRGYPDFAAQALAERRQAQLPPFSHQALIRAEAHRLQSPLDFLEQVASLAKRLEPRLQILGPVPAPMPKRAGRHRAQLLIQGDRREPLHRLLDRLLPRIGELPGSRVRWSLDVDPLDLY